MTRFPPHSNSFALAAAEDLEVAAANARSLRGAKDAAAVLGEHPLDVPALELLDDLQSRNRKRKVLVEDSLDRVDLARLRSRRWGGRARAFGSHVHDLV